MDKLKIKNKEGKKLKSSLLENKDFIIERLKNEWLEAEKIFANEKRKEQLVELVKNTGIVVGKGLLTLLLIGGFLTVAVVAPNIFGAYGRLTKQSRYFRKNQFNKNKHYLQRHGFIKIKKRDNDYFEIFLTEKGKDKAVEEAFKDLKIRKPQRDGYWRVVMFDIPDQYKWARDALRKKLREMEFYQFQKSVFVTPYSCEKEIDFLVKMLSIGSFVYLIKTKDFSGNEELNKFFNSTN